MYHARVDRVSTHRGLDGLEAREPALEDDLAAEYLTAALTGAPPAFAPLRERLLASPGADRLRRLGQHDDLEWCTRLDVVDLVPVVRQGNPPSAVGWRTACGALG